MLASERNPPARLIGRIPVANIWFLFLYAWDLARFADRLDVDLEADDADLPSLIARLLAHAVERRLRRNLSRAYRPEAAVLSRVRGRIDLLATEAGRLRERGRVACRFEELTVDTPRNRFVRSALDHIASQLSDAALAHRCHTLAGDLGRLGVSDRKPPPLELATDVIGRNEVEDRLVVALAKLAFELALPTEEEGETRLVQALRDEIAARRLFERAVGGFYKATLDAAEGWTVKTGKPLKWQIDRTSEGGRSIFPEMQADIVLQNKRLGLGLVIDTKFTSLLTDGRFRAGLLRSGYIYQMYAYIRSQEGRAFDPALSEGLLLHPAIGPELDEWIEMQGLKMRFATVDLGGTAQAIRDRLTDLIGSRAPRFRSETGTSNANVEGRLNTATDQAFSDAGQRASEFELCCTTAAEPRAAVNRRAV